MKSNSVTSFGNKFALRNAMRKFLLLGCLLLGALNSQAQFIGTINSAMAKSIADGTVYVLNDEPNAGTLRKLAKRPEELTTYTDAITSQNDALAEAFEKYWDFTESVQFITPTELKEKRKTAAANDFLIMVNFEERRLVKGESEGINKSASLMLIPLKNEPMTVVNPYQVPMANFQPSPGDVIYAIRLMNSHLASVKTGGANDWKRQLSANSASLPSQTILVKQQDLDTKVDETEKLAKYYSHPIEAAEESDVEAAIVDANPQFAYVVLVRAQAPNTYTAVLVDAGTGNICAISPVQGTAGPIKVYPFLKDKNIRDLGKNITTAAAGVSPDAVQRTPAASKPPAAQQRQTEEAPQESASESAPSSTAAPRPAEPRPAAPKRR